MNKYQLFNQAFDDGENFVKYYFEQRNNKPKTFLKYISNELVAQINVIDLDILYHNQNLKTALISGVAVEKNWQNKGVMKDFLSEILQNISKNYDIAILSPVNDNYYKKFGFKPLFKANFENINYSSNNDFYSKPATTDDVDILLQLYENKTKNCDLHQKITKSTLLDLILDCKTSGNQLLVLYNKNTPIGWVFVDSEIVFINTATDKNILQNIKELDKNQLCIFCKDGIKELFQIKIFNDNIKNIDICNCIIVDRY